MTLRVYDPRILAIDLRHRRFGFAVYEGHRMLLDWGVRAYPVINDDESSIAIKRLRTLISMFGPVAIVIKRERWEKRETNANMQKLIDAFESEAFARLIPIRLIREQDIRSTFVNFGCTTREENAAALARIFPELAWDLPAKRRTWQPEHSRMTVFDALAIGLAYWHHPHEEIRNPILP
jgi:RNase H-fold protein (predicted Holliday junction resolvase)